MIRVLSHLKQISTRRQSLRAQQSLSSSWHVAPSVICNEDDQTWIWGALRPAGTACCKQKVQKPGAPSQPTPPPSQHIPHVLPILTLACLALACPAIPAPFLTKLASKGTELGYCQGEIRTGWHFYCDPDLLEQETPKPEPEAAVPPAAPPVPAVPVAPASPTERMMALRAALENAKHLAILEPTPANLQNYMASQLAVTRMASTFADQWQRVLYQTPGLDANVTNPVSAVGSRVWQDLRVAEQQDALKNAASTQGLLFVFEGPDTCAVCPIAAEILGSIEARYGIRVLPVSLDGARYPEFPAPAADQGQLASLGIDDLPRPNLALIEPGTNKVTVLGAGLLTEDLILERVYVLTRTKPGQRYADEPFAETIVGGRPRSEALDLDAIRQRLMGDVQ